MLGRSRLDFESEPGSIPVGAIVETGTAWGVPMPGSLLFYFCPLIPRIGLLVFLLVSAAIDDENCFKFKWLRNYAVTGQGHQAENTNRNNSLNHWLDSIFLGEFSRLV
jgi:hypothetical protein